MRGENNVIAYFAVEHMNSNWPGWCRSAYAEILFNGLTYQQKRNGAEEGDRLRALIKPTHDCWQATGVSEFLEYGDANRMLRALRRKRPGRKFRLVAVGEARVTEVLS